MYDPAITGKQVKVAKEKIERDFGEKFDELRTSNETMIKMLQDIIRRIETIEMKIANIEVKLGEKN